MACLVSDIIEVSYELNDFTTRRIKCLLLLGSASRVESTTFSSVDIDINYCVASKVFLEFLIFNLTISGFYLLVLNLES